MHFEISRLTSKQRDVRVLHVPQILAGLQPLRFLRRHGDDGQGEDVAARFDQIHHLFVSSALDVDVVPANGGIVILALAIQPLNCSRDS